MNHTRIKALQDLLNDDPNDAFTLYALALEYQDEDPAKAAAYFTTLYAKHPDYVPTYYVFSQLLWNEGKQNEALTLLKRGIEVAEAQKNIHALTELRTSLLNKELGLDD